MINFNFYIRLQSIFTNLKPTAMKKLLFFLSLFVLLSGLSYCQKAIWEYPSKPGDSSWSELTTTKKRIDACQIPDSILLKSGTQQLLNICLQYPLLPEIYLSSSPYKAFKILVEGSNGFQELIQRADIGEVLLNKYHELNPEKVCEISGAFEKGKYVLSVAIVEYIIIHDDTFSKILFEDKLKIYGTAKKYYLTKNRYPDIFSLTFGVAPTCMVLYKTNPTLIGNFTAARIAVVERFMTTGYPKPKEILVEIYDNSK